MRGVLLAGCVAVLAMATALPVAAQQFRINFHPAGGAADFLGWYGGAALVGERARVSPRDVDGVINGGAFLLQTINAEGLGGEVFLGRNWADGRLVYGVELSGMQGGADGSSVFDRANFDETLHWDQNWNASLDGKVGFVKAGSFVYARFGVSQASVNVGFLDLDVPGGSVENDNRRDHRLRGVNIGFGVERRYQHARGRLELIYTKYAKFSGDLSAGSAFPVEYDASALRLKLGVVFGF